MQSRKEIEAKVFREIGREAPNAQIFMFGELLSAILDLREQNAQIISLLSERHTRREKGKPKCAICNGFGYTVQFEEDEGGPIHSIKIPCPNPEYI